MAKKKEVIVSVLLGAGAGALVGLGLWWYANKKLEEGFQSGSQTLANRLGVGSREMAEQFQQGRTQLRAELAQQVEAQVRPAVQAEIRRTLTSYNITAETGRRIDRVLAAAERLNLI